MNWLYGSWQIVELKHAWISSGPTRVALITNTREYRTHPCCIHNRHLHKQPTNRAGINAIIIDPAGWVDLPFIRLDDSWREYEFPPTVWRQRDTPFSNCSFVSFPLIWMLTSSLHFQSNFRAVSEQFWSNFRAILEQFWSNIGTILKQFQSSFRAISEQFQSNFRAILEQFPNNFGAILYQSWNNFRAVSEHLQSNFGAILEKSWNNFRAVSE